MSLYDGGDIRCEGSIPQQVTQAAEVIEEWVPNVQALAPSGRFEPRPIIPRDVWLEGLVNAVLAAIGRACYADTQSAACAQAAYDAVPPRARERGSKSTPIAGVASLAAPR